MNIEQALKALAEEDASQEAAPYLEASLLQAYRRNRRTAWRRALPWALSAAAAAVLLFAALRPHSPLPVVNSTVGRAPAPAAGPLAGPVVEPKQPARGPAADRVRPTSVVPVETLTEFFPLLEIAPPFERGELVRVTVPASAMRRVGLPVREEMLLQPVQAEILFGQEGLARAIRFVSFEPQF